MSVKPERLDHEVILDLYNPARVLDLAAATDRSEAFGTKEKGAGCRELKSTTWPSIFAWKNGVNVVSRRHRFGTAGLPGPGL